MIAKAYDKTNEYYLGYNYLKEKSPSVIHMLSAYEFTTFKRTAMMLEYDFKGDVMFKPFEDDVERYVCFSENKVFGVAVRAFFSEYSPALNYEEYLLILAEDAESFWALFYTVRKRKGRYELITFRDEERKYLIDKKGQLQSEIHSWQVYLIDYRLNACEFHEIEYCLFSQKYVEAIKQASDDESNPLRYFKFDSEGVEGYKVWVYKENNRPIMFVSVVPYVGVTAEIKIGMVEESVDSPEKASAFLGSIVGLWPSTYQNAIFRVKDCCEAIRKILDVGRFRMVAQEQHFHMED